MPDSNGFQHPTPPDLPINADVTQIVLLKGFDAFDDLCEQGMVDASWTWIKGMERFIVACQDVSLPMESTAELLHRAYGRCWALRFGM